MELGGWLSSWIAESTNKEQRKRAMIILEKVKAQQKEIPKGYREEWVDGPLRSKVRKLIKIKK